MNCEEARRFLARHGVDFPSFIKTGDDMQFINTLERRWSGALPATLIYDAEGDERFFIQGKSSYVELKHKVLQVLGSGNGAKSEGGR
jgi:hypothetical protein